MNHHANIVPCRPRLKLEAISTVAPSAIGHRQEALQTEVKVSYGQDFNQNVIDRLSKPSADDHE
jgi:hypothetical protein